MQTKQALFTDRLKLTAVKFGGSYDLCLPPFPCLSVIIHISGCNKFHRPHAIWRLVRRLYGSLCWLLL